MSGIPKRILSIALITILTLCAGLSYQEESSYAAESNSSGISAKYRTKSEVKKRLASVWNLDYDVKYDKVPSLTSPYSIGKISDESKANTLKFLNAIRYIAGIRGTVALNDDYSELAQAASLVNAVNDELSHSPAKPTGMSSSLYESAKKGASKSNLAMGVTNLKDEMLMYLDDSGVDTLGHRRWLLYPMLKEVGFGMAGDYSAAYVINNFSTKNAKKYSGIVWPAQNMPLELWDDDNAWSISFGKKLTKSKIKVTIKKNNGEKTWSFSSKKSEGTFSVSNDNYGQPGCVIFKPKDISYQDGDVFRVTVKNGKNTIAKYTVNFFYALS